MATIKKVVLFEKCSHPDCECPLQEVITNVHCEKYHGMTKKEMIEKYGEIKEIKKKVITGGDMYV